MRSTVAQLPAIFHSKPHYKNSGPRHCPSTIMSMWGSYVGKYAVPENK